MSFEDGESQYCTYLGGFACCRVVSHSAVLRFQKGSDGRFHIVTHCDSSEARSYRKEQNRIQQYVEEIRHKGGQRRCYD